MVWKNLFIFSLYLIVALITLLITDSILDWPTTIITLERIILPAIIVFAGVLHLIVRLVAKPKTKTASKPTATSAINDEEDQTAKTTPKSKKIVPLTARIYETILILIGLVLIAGLFTLLLFLIIYARDASKEIISNAPQTRVVEGLLIGHSYNLTPDKEYSEWISPGIVYEVFELEAGQRWKWYFEKDIQYRIKKTGQELFTLALRAKQNGSEMIANYAGVLQLKSTTPRNHVTCTRFIPRQTK